MAKREKVITISVSVFILALLCVLVFVLSDRRVDEAKENEPPSVLDEVFALMEDDDFEGAYDLLKDNEDKECETVKSYLSHITEVLKCGENGKALPRLGDIGYGWAHAYLKYNGPLKKYINDYGSDLIALQSRHQKNDVYAIYEKYTELSIKNASVGKFTSMSDSEIKAAIKKYGRYPYETPEPYVPPKPKVTATPSPTPKTHYYFPSSGDRYDDTDPENYDNPEDFYDDNPDYFDDYADAEGYWEDNN